jgi:hypothetical protein
MTLRAEAGTISGPNPRRRGIGRGAMELFAGMTDEAVELGAVRSLDALLELGVDIAAHLRVVVTNLAHDPLDVEVVRK